MPTTLGLSFLATTFGSPVVTTDAVVVVGTSVVVVVDRLVVDLGGATVVADELVLGREVTGGAVTTAVVEVERVAKGPDSEQPPTTPASVRPMRVKPRTATSRALSPGPELCFMRGFYQGLGRVRLHRQAGAGPSLHASIHVEHVLKAEADEYGGAGSAAVAASADDIYRSILGQL
jgi:hypothetical protein